MTNSDSNNVSHLNEQGVPQRVILFRDLAEGRGTTLVDALAAADDVYAYRNAASFLTLVPSRIAPAAVVFHAAPSMTQDLFREIEACSSLSQAPMAIITDSSDLAFYAQCYDRGVKGVLPTSMLAKNAVLVLRLMVNGGIFLPPELISRGSDPD